MIPTLFIYLLYFLFGKSIPKKIGKKNRNLTQGKQGRLTFCNCVFKKLSDIIYDSNKETFKYSKTESGRE